MSEYQFTVVIEPDERGYHAFVPALPGCHSFGDTVEEAKTNILGPSKCTLNPWSKTERSPQKTFAPCSRSELGFKSPGHKKVASAGDFLIAGETKGLSYFVL